LQRCYTEAGVRVLRNGAEVEFAIRKVRLGSVMMFELLDRVIGFQGRVRATDDLAS